MNVYLSLTLTLQYCILSSLQLFKAITFEVGQENKVSCVHRTKYRHFSSSFMSKTKEYILRLTSSGTSDPSCKEREKARLFLHHQNLPGLPTVHLGKCPCIPVTVK